jgi:hypothetical protein
MRINPLHCFKSWRRDMETASVLQINPWRSAGLTFYHSSISNLHQPYETGITILVLRC